MAISRVDFGTSYNHINSIGRNVDNEPKEKVVLKQNENITEANVDSKEKEEPKRASAHSNPSDFTFDFKSAPRFNLEGAKSKMEDIDVKKAVSDMNQESVLNQYKFFVGSTNMANNTQPNLGTDADGTVLLKN